MRDEHRSVGAIHEPLGSHQLECGHRPNSELSLTLSRLLCDLQLKGPHVAADTQSEHAPVPISRAMTWKLTCGWLEMGQGICRQTIDVEVLPSVAGPFRYPDICEGETMQVVGLMKDDGARTASIGLGGRGSWPPKVGVTYPET
jgi:hypothetical protein